MAGGTAQLVFQGHNNLRYLITGDEFGGAVTIPNDGGASPDLLTDTLAGPLKDIARARLDGLGTVPPGPLTQLQARAILLADGAAANVGNPLVSRAKCLVTARAGTAPSVDANVDIDGDPILQLIVPANGLAYLDVTFIDGIGA